jgi:photosystem II stability/assembly factor-like uncharacterized protein
MEEFKMKTIITVLAVSVLILRAQPVRAVCWDEIATMSSIQSLMKVDFVDSQMGWAIRSLGFNSAAVLHTTNGGESWAVQFTAGYRLENIDFVDANHGWAVGYYSIYRTVDGGATWTRTSVDNATMLGVSFVDANNGWVVGDDLLGGNSPIWHTTNGGANWTPQSSGTIYGLNEVTFSDVNHGCAVGLGGVIINTSNGGATWISRSSGTTYSLYGVSMPLTQIYGLAVGAHGTVLGTFDSGDNWATAVSVSTTATLYDVSMCGMDGWVVGDSSLILRTASIGFEWTREHSAPTLYPLLLGVSCIGTEAWAVGQNNATAVNIVYRNTCPVPQNLTIQYSPEHWIGHIYLPPVVALVWNRAADSGSVVYKVYEDSVVNGSYLNLVGTASDSNYLIWWGGDQPRRYYMVKSDNP